MNRIILERIESLERRVAILESKEDPGMLCKGTADSDCYRGSVDVYDNGRRTGRSTCPTCNGKGRVYPKLN